MQRICNDMTKTFDAHPEHTDDDRCMVFLDDGKMGGLVTHGYDDLHEAMTDLLIHLRAMFRASGKDMMFAFLNPDGTVDAI
jgi:hypothetical protein